MQTIIRHKQILCLLCFLMAWVVGAVPTAAADDEFKVVGYYCWKSFDEPVEQLDTEKLTHVIYGFLIPQADGGNEPLTEGEQLQELIAKCHSTGTKVYLALGGGGTTTYTYQPIMDIFEQIAADDDLRAKYIVNVMEIVQQYDFDGVDLDWEYPKYTTCHDYEKLVLEMDTVLRAADKGFSVSLAGTRSTDGTNLWQAIDSVTERTLACFDFVNIMCYDLGTNTDNHSPLAFAETSINYYRNIRKLPPEKIVLGMPLYAKPSWIQYRDLVAMDKANAYRDYVATTPLESTYNGLNTLREKTMLAWMRAGGVMLFDVNEDTHDETSVLAMIAETTQALQGKSSKLVQEQIKVVVNHQLLQFTADEGEPFVDQNNRTLLPVRKLLEAVGATVDYSKTEQGTAQIQINKGQQTIRLDLAQPLYWLNDRQQVMDSTAVVKAGRTYLPARALLEALGYQISWSHLTKTLYIQS